MKLKKVSFQITEEMLQLCKEDLTINGEKGEFPCVYWY